jgi:hypothetical protein
MHKNAISTSKEFNKEDSMEVQQAMLAEQAFLEVEELFNNYDFCGTIEIALPLLRRHRRTLATLRNALQPVRAAKPASDGWADDLVAVYSEFGGQASDPAIYRRMKQLRQSEGRSWPPSAHSVIRQTRQAHNVEAPQYRGGSDLFRMVRPGLWRLKG